MNQEYFVEDCDLPWSCSQSCAFCGTLIIAEMEKHVKGVHKTRFCSDECLESYRLKIEWR